MQTTEVTPNSGNVVEELAAVIRQHLDKYPRLSLNGLSKRCKVSEPTLRRIVKGQIKTTPTLTTVVDILSSINREPSIRRLSEMYPGAIGEVLKEGFSIIQDQNYDYQYVNDLNEHLADQQAYLIFKLAANRCGVTRQKIRELFGLVGEEKLNNLMMNDIIYQVDSTLHTKVKGFSLGHELFINHFKAVANFIDTAQQNGPKKNLYYNFSNSVNEAGLKELIQVQRQAFKKVAKILNDEKYAGNIPAFAIGAVDTLDNPTPPA